MAWNKWNLTKRTYGSSDLKTGISEVAAPPPIAEEGSPETGLNPFELAINNNAKDPTIYLLDSENQIREIKPGGLGEELNWLNEAFTKMEFQRESTITNEDGTSSTEVITDFRIRANKEFYSVLGITAYGAGTVSGGGGEGGATTLGGLTNVSSTADNSASEDMVLFLPSGKKEWTIAKASDLMGGGLDENALSDYLVTNNYITKNYLSDNGYATQDWINEQEYVTRTTTQTITGTKYFDAAVYMKKYVYIGPSKTSATDGNAGIVLGANGTIELSAGTPFIDFHFNNSTGDYTTRIIEAGSGTLSFVTPNGVRIGSTGASPNHMLHVTGSTYSTGTIYSGFLGVALRMLNTATLSAQNADSTANYDLVRLNNANHSVFGTGSYNNGTTSYYQGGYIIIRANLGGNIQFYTNNTLTGTWTSANGLFIGGTKNALNDGKVGFAFNVVKDTSAYLGITGSATIAPEIRFFNGNATSWTSRIVPRGATPSNGDIIINPRLHIRATSSDVMGSTHRLYVDGSAYFATNAHAAQAIRIGDIWLEYDATNNAIRVRNNTTTQAANFYATGGVTAYGVGPDIGEIGGGGTAYDRLDNWNDYTVDKAGYVLSAKLGFELFTNATALTARVTSLESGSGSYVTIGTPQRITGQKTFSTAPWISSDINFSGYGKNYTGTTLETSGAITISTGDTSGYDPRFVFFRRGDEETFRIHEAYDGILTLKSTNSKGTSGVYISASESRTTPMPTASTRLMVNGGMYSSGSYILSGSGKTSQTDGLAGTIFSPGYIELQTGSTNGGYIDFHYGTTTVDYTSRIIEGTQGVIGISPQLKVSGTGSPITWGGVTQTDSGLIGAVKLYLSSSAHAASAIYVSDSGKTVSTDGLRGITIHGANPYITIQQNSGSSDWPRVRFYAGNNTGQFVMGYPSVISWQGTSGTGVPGLYIGTSVRTTALTYVGSGSNTTSYNVGLWVSSGAVRIAGRSYFGSSIFVSGYGMSAGSDGTAGVYIESGAPRIILSRGSTQGENTSSPSINFSWTGLTTTSYITETTSGTISIYNRLYVNSTGSTYNFNVSGTSYLGGNTTINGSLTTSSSLSIWADLIFQTTSGNKGIHANRAATSNVLYFYLGNASSTTEARYVMSTVNFRPDGTALGSTVSNSFHPNLGNPTSYWGNTYVSTIWIGTAGKTTGGDKLGGVWAGASASDAFIGLATGEGSSSNPRIVFYRAGVTTQTSIIQEGYAGVLSIPNYLSIGVTLNTLPANSAKFYCSGNAHFTSTTYFANSTNYYFNSAGNIGLHQSLTFYTGATNHYINSVGQALGICIGTAGSMSAVGNYVFTSSALYVASASAAMNLGTTTLRWQSLFVKSTIWSGTSYGSVGAGTTGAAYAPGFIELSAATPHIGFWHANSTTRTTLVQSSYSGILSIANTIGLYLGPAARSSSMSYRLWVSGTSYYSGAAYFQNTVHVGSGKTGQADGISGTYIGPGAIELSSVSHGGFIDFHYGNSTSDYTSRIIEYYQGVISLTHTLYVGGTRSSAAAYTCHVNGSLYASSATTLNSTLTVAGIATFNNSATNAVYIPNGSLRIGNGLLRWDDTNKAFYIQRSDGSDANFYASGGVTAYGLISNTSTDWKVGSLTVAGTLSVTNAMTANTTITATGLITANGSLRSTRIGVNADPNSSYQLYVNGTSYITGNTYIGGVNTSYRLYVSGNTYINGTLTYTGTSDRRLKTGIVKLTGVLDKLTSLNAYSFNYMKKADKVLGFEHSKELQYGLMYDEVKSAFPQLTGITSGYGTVEYLPFISLTIAGLIELNSRHESLQERVERLEKENAELKKKLNNI